MKELSSANIFYDQPEFKAILAALQERKLPEVTGLSGVSSKATGSVLEMGIRLKYLKHKVKMVVSEKKLAVCHIRNLFSGKL